MQIPCTSNGDEAQYDDHIAKGVRESLQSRLTAHNTGRKCDKKVSGNPEDAHALDQQVNPVAFALPEAGHRVGEHFQDYL